jgi:predicted metal-dependent peptidase
LNNDPVQTKLGAARTRLILERPFIGALVMHLPLRPADPAWCETTATDARALYYNPGHIARLTLAETQFALAHEAVHCALGHFARRQHRDRGRWDIACDHAANLLLAADGLKPPPHALANPDFQGLSAEEIYPLIPPDSSEHILDRHLFEERAAPEYAAAAAARGSRGAGHRGATRGGDTPPRDGPEPGRDSWDDAGDERRETDGNADVPLSEAGPGREDLAARWRMRIVAAAQQARRAGRLADSWLRLVDGLVQPQLPWRALLARFLMSAARDDYSFQRPSRREGAALLPRLASHSVDVVVALDTSGSIAPDELAQFTREVNALKGQIRARVTVQACDERIDARGPWVFEPWENIVLPRAVGGGGGTRFVPVFDWIAAARWRPDALLYFTDAQGEFPPRAPAYPVIWLVKGRGRVPWGERIQLN